MQLGVVQHHNVYPQLLKWLALFGDSRTSEVAFVRLENTGLEKSSREASALQKPQPPQQPNQQPFSVLQQPYTPSTSTTGQQASLFSATPQTTVPQAVTTPVARPTVSQPPVQPKPQHNYTIVQALDPNIDLDVMCDMATKAPELREYIARNRSAYPSLLEWLSSLNDPAINRALKMRS
jgi:hypothetical protein